MSGNGLFAKMFVSLATHPRAIQAEDKAPGCMSLYAWAILHVRGQDGDGWFHRASLRLSWCPPEHVSVFADALVEVGLWSKDGDLFSIEKYEKKNEVSEQIEERKKHTRERVTRYRRVTDTNVTRTTDTPCNASVPDSVSVSDSVVSSSVSTPPARASGDGMFGFSVQAWMDGVRRVLGSAPPRLNQADVGHLVDLVREHTAAIPESERLAWVTDTAEQFAKNDDPKYQLRPSRCAIWLAAGKPNWRSSPVTRLVQPVPANGPAYKVGGDGR